MSKSSSILAVILLLSIAIISGAHGHLLQALLAILLLSWLCLTALPLSRILFPKNHPEATILFSLPVGYIVHSVILSLLSFFLPMHSITFIVYAFLITAGLFLSRTRLREVTISSTAILWQLLIVAVSGWIFLRVGAETQQGFAYRAYFNADFFKHLGITGAILHTHLPPLNPYLSGYVLHYYWFFYIIPVYFRMLFPSFPAESLLVEFTLFGSLTFIACLYATIRAFFPSKRILPFVFALLLFGGSYEGIYGIHHLHVHNQSWRAFTTLNIDALTRWMWQTPQVDTLFRALLYAPQHLLALSIVLLWLILRKRNLPAAGSVILYTAIFATLGFAAIIGVIFIFSVSLFLTVQMIRKPRDTYKEFFIAGGLGIIFLILYFPAFQMFNTHEGSLHFGLVAPIWGHLPGYLILNWGALLICGIAGIFSQRSDLPRAILCFFLLLSLFCMHYIKDTVGGSEVTLKLGYLVDLSLLLLSAAFFDRIPSTTLAVLSTVLILPASVTTVMDIYNTQDIHNSQFTTYIPNSDRAALDWMAQNLPPKTVVQDYGLEGANARVAPIPAFGERIIYLGDPFHSRAFQVPYADVNEREKIVWSLFHKNSPQLVSDIAQKRRIEYLFLGASQSQIIPDFRYQLQAPYFSVVFQDGATLLARVNAVKISAEELQETNSQVIFREETGRALLRADFGENFYEADGSPDAGLGRWMKQDGELNLQAEASLHGTLQMTAQSLGKPRHIRVLRGDQVLLTGTILPRRTMISFPVSLAAGPNGLKIHTEEEPDVADRYAHNGDQRLLSIRITDLKFAPDGSNTQ